MRDRSFIRLSVIATVAVFLLGAAPARSGSPPRRFAPSGAPALPDSERSALIAFYDATGGGGWVNHTDWFVDPDPCDWFGVGCTRAPEGNHVAGLSFPNNNLSGSIPGSIGGLPALQSLDVSGNSLGGSIPSAIGGLGGLVLLNLSRNGFSGPVPGFLGGLGRLKYLDLNENHLTGPIPASLGNLTSLERLNLFGNPLNCSLPAQLGNLTSLKHIRIEDSGLTGPIPSTLGNLTNLQYLWLAGNHLDGSIPAQLGNLAALLALDLYDSNLTGPIPPELGNLTSLRYLCLSGNDLAGGIPGELGSLVNLQQLDLADNRLTGPIPAELAGLTNLTTLELHDNDKGDGSGLSGPIPDALGAMASLETLLLANNRLDGDLPAFGAAAANSTPRGAAASRLRVVSVSHNRLTGIRLGWGTGTPLTHVDLRGNRIQQSIPAALFQIPTLEYVDLGENLLRDSIPDVSVLVNLKTLKLDQNNLTGAIPVNISALRNLEVLDLAQNHIGGFIPSDLGGLSRLTVLNLSRNLLEGMVPERLENLAELRTLDLHGNANLSELPFALDLGRLTKVETLNLQDCNLGGGIQCNLSGLKSLKELWLGGNHMQLVLSSSLGGMTALEWMDLSGNSVTGIPKEIGNLKKLIVLRLSHCGLASLPDGIGGLSALMELTISGNALTELPAALAGLLKLTYLDASECDSLRTIRGDWSRLDSLETFACSECKHLENLPTGFGDLASLRILNLASDPQLHSANFQTALRNNTLEEVDVSRSFQIIGEGGAEIPASIGELRHLRKLNLLAALGYTELPASVWSLPDLVELRLDGNDGLEGRLSEDMPVPPKLQVLRLDATSLCGTLPRAVMDAHDLRVLYIRGPYGSCLCYPGDPEFQAWLWLFRQKRNLYNDGEPCRHHVVNTAIVGDAGGTLHSPGDGTDYTFSPGTFSPGVASAASGATIAVTHTGMDPSTVPGTGRLVGILHYYDVSAQDALGNDVQPQKTYTVTIRYGPIDLASSPVVENTLALYRWNGSAWVREPTSRLDLAAQTVTANPSRFSTWAVLGERAAPRVRLPAVFKSDQATLPSQP